MNRYHHLSVEVHVCQMSGITSVVHEPACCVAILRMMASARDHFQLHWNNTHRLFTRREAVASPSIGFTLGRVGHYSWSFCWLIGTKVKGKVLPYSLPSVGPGADPDVQAVSPQVTWSHPPGCMLPLLSARPAVTFPAEERHRPSASIKLYCLVTEAHACKQLAQGCYLEADWPRFEPATF